MKVIRIFFTGTDERPVLVGIHTPASTVPLHGKLGVLLAGV